MGLLHIFKEINNYFLKLFTLLINSVLLQVLINRIYTVRLKKKNSNPLNLY